MHLLSSFPRCDFFTVFFFFYFHLSLTHCSLTASIIRLSCKNSLSNKVMVWQICVLLMNNAIYSHTVSFLEDVGSWNIHCTLWYNICTLSLQARWWTINHLFSLLSSVPQPCSSEKVEIWQIPVSISWQRQKTWLVTITFKVHTQGLYIVRPHCLCEIGFAVKQMSKLWHESHCPFESLHYHLCLTSRHSSLLNDVAFESVRHSWFHVLVVVYCEFIQPCFFVCCSRI